MNTRSVARLAGRVAVLACVAVALSGCDVMVGVGGMGGKEVAKDQWQKTYTLASGGQLEIININGSIQTEATDGSAVEIVADRSARAATPEAAKDLLQKTEIQERVAPDKIGIEVKQPSGLRGGVEVAFVVKVPRTAALRLSNTNGKITIVGGQGAVTAEVTNGSVTGRGLSGAVDASTTNGSVTMDLDAVAKDGIKLGTTNGGVNLTLPVGAQAEIRASCVNGGVNATNLTLEHLGNQSRRRIDAKLNGGGPRIELDTTNGGIRITGK